ncbi:RepB family plasmid replication initiator protein, partial [Escherichia coli]|uniref:RepB family plasmid replication initiator protein n=1 Tax=Escherichia coli TaxID=562 RepID=UPI003EE05292
VEASYKLTLQEQRFLLLCISRLKSGADAELQKTMTITAAEYLFSIPNIERKSLRAIILSPVLRNCWRNSYILIL